MIQRSTAFAAAIGIGLWLSLAQAAGAQPANGADPDWPCVQRLVPEIAGGMIWAGPPLDQVALAENDRPAAQLAAELAARRVPVEEAAKLVEDYAAKLTPAERDQHLAALFKRTLAIINQDRGSIIQGIRRFSRGQRALADKINAANETIQQLGADKLLERENLIAERDWDVRIFDDRRGSLAYLCEQPVLLEQRAFALARTIAGHLQ